MRDIELRRRERQWIDRERGRESHTHRHDDDDCDDEADLKLGALTELPLNCRAIGVKSLTMNCNEPA